MITAADKIRAWAIFNAALAKDPELRGSVCSICGTCESLIGHHKDYRFPLQVAWICRSDHAILHIAEDKRSRLLLNGEDPEPPFKWE